MKVHERSVVNGLVGKAVELSVLRKENLSVIKNIHEKDEVEAMLGLNVYFT